MLGLGMYVLMVEGDDVGLFDGVEDGVSVLMFLVLEWYSRTLSAAA